jgi:hypothetical protein
MRCDSVRIWCPECDDGELDVLIYPEEPAVMYYPDGSGYPGAPADTEVVAQTCGCPLDLDTVHDLAIARHSDQTEAEEAAYWDDRIERAWERERYGE